MAAAQIVIGSILLLCLLANFLSHPARLIYIWYIAAALASVLLELLQRTAASTFEDCLKFVVVRRPFGAGTIHFVPTASGMQAMV